MIPDFSSAPLEFILVIDENDLRDMSSVMALIDSLALRWAEPTDLFLTVVHQDNGPPKQIRHIVDQTPGITCRYISQVDDLAIPGTVLGKRALSLAYARLTNAPYYMVLESKTFCVRPLRYATLIFDGRARSQWESMEKHPDWKYTAERLLDIRLDQQPLSAHALSVSPVIYSRQLALSTLDKLSESSGQDGLSLLIGLDTVYGDWGDSYLYSLANWSELSRYHVMQGEEGVLDFGLHSDIDLWRANSVQDWRPKEWSRLTTHGLFVRDDAAGGVKDLALDKIYRSLVNF